MPPRPKTTARAADLDLGGVDHRADAGRHAAADVADLVEGRVLAHLGQRDLRHHRVVGEGRTAHVVMDRRAIQHREPRGAVGQQPLALRRRGSPGRGWSCRRGSIRIRGIPACRAGSRDRRASRLVTPSPTSSTTPAPSWPRIAGKIPSGSSPERVNSSVWQSPVALISTRTSPAFGPSRFTSMISSGLPASKATAARVFMQSSSHMSRFSK